MSQTDSLAQLMKWSARNMAYNLDFIPDDKLNWKPEPSANSALEVTNHTVMAISHLKSMIEEKEAPAPAVATTRDAAKANLIAAADDYAAYLGTLTPERIGQIVPTKVMGDMPVSRIMVMPIVDTIHHHGQIAYLQTLLGDNESHFENADVN